MDDIGSEPLKITPEKIELGPRNLAGPRENKDTRKKEIDSTVAVEDKIAVQQSMEGTITFCWENPLEPEGGDGINRHRLLHTSTLLALFSGKN